MKGLIFNVLCLATLLISAGQISGQQVYDLKFDSEKYVAQSVTFGGKTLIVRAYEDIVYVASPADKQSVKMINSLYCIGQPESKTAEYWRIRHGTKDKDTGLAVSVILATYLQNKGFNVNLELPWDIPHSGDYDLTELFDWIDNICK